MGAAFCTLKTMVTAFGFVQRTAPKGCIETALIQVRSLETPSTSRSAHGTSPVSPTCVSSCDAPLKVCKSSDSADEAWTALGELGRCLCEEAPFVEIYAALRNPSSAVGRQRDVFPLPLVSDTVLVDNFHEFVGALLEVFSFDGDARLDGGERVLCDEALTRWTNDESADADFVQFTESRRFSVLSLCSTNFASFRTLKFDQILFWKLNPRPSVSHTVALPTEQQKLTSSAPCRLSPALLTSSSTVLPCR